jgi:hypothetical protein
MFGESDSESPRVPSPWDSLISTSPSPSPPTRSQTTPSSLSVELIPRLVPEADEGNVEYKLQLLAPSPARFARLVTQLKWRLLEGGGQAYYELGVADSGALVGLPRAELEQSLETLEMMAGEIGASVIVVKEIEVPAAMAGIAAAQTDRWNGKRRRKAMIDDGSSESSTAVDGTSATTETETEHSTDVDFEDDLEDMSMTLMLDGNNQRRRYSHTHSSGSSGSLFSMDPDLDPDPADSADTEPDDDPAPPAQPYYSIDLEIMSVFKPRPMRARMHTHNHVLGPAKMKRIKKLKHLPQTQPPLVDDPSAGGDIDHKGHHAHYRHTDEAGSGKQHQHHALSKNSHRRQTRERKRAEKRKALVAYATGNTDPHTSIESDTLPSFSQEGDVDRVTLHEVVKPTLVETELVEGLEELHVSLGLEVAEVVSKADVPAVHLLAADDEDEEGDDDVFASPTVATSHATFIGGNTTTTYLSAPSCDLENGVQGDGAAHNRLIVEALVVRKMSLDEAFLDFGGFALM